MDDVLNVVFPDVALVNAPTGRGSFIHGIADSIAFAFADEVVNFIQQHSPI